MHFAFTPEQLALREAVRDLLAKECTTAHLRGAWENNTGRVPGLWALLANMGVPGLCAPEAAYGGLGCDEVDLVGVLEESGRAAVPEPLVDTAAVAVPLLAEVGDGTLLPALVSGDATASVVDPAGDFAVWASTASTLVLFDNDSVHVVPRGDAVLEPRASLDGARRLSWVDAAVSDATRVGDADSAARAFDRGVLGTAAQLLGLADQMLEVTVEYTKQRQQFGVPIGSFQAVKHHLANVRIAIEFARPLVYRAASSTARHVPDRAVHVSMAKAQASDAAAQAARAALQCHGAIGYTTEYDLHLFMKRTWALTRSWGDAAWHRRRVERAILDPNRRRSAGGDT